MIEPTKKNIQKWVKALRSGKYKQGIFRLQSEDDRYCCLGVACKEFIGKKARVDSFGLLAGGIITNISQPNAPGWLTALNDNFFLKSGRQITGLNDSGELTFDELADCLELVYIHKILD